MRRSLPFIAASVVLAIGGCMTAPEPVGRQIAHLLIAATILASAPFLAAFLYRAMGHHLLARGMSQLAHPGTLAGEPVRLVPGLASPVVAGLWRPRIFCAEDLASHLDREEVEAVILHERHHRIYRAPLRMVALSALSPALGRLARGRSWLERERARIEIAADRYALAEGASRPAIASALMRLSAAPYLVEAPGFASAADLRIRALLDEPTGLDADGHPRRPLVAVGLLLAACGMAFISAWVS